MKLHFYKSYTEKRIRDEYDIFVLFWLQINGIWHEVFCAVSLCSIQYTDFINFECVHILAIFYSFPPDIILVSLTEDHKYKSMVYILLWYSIIGLKQNLLIVIFVHKWGSSSFRLRKRYVTPIFKKTMALKYEYLETNVDQSKQLWHNVNV